MRRAQGNLAGALESYEAGLAILERLAAADPGNSEWQRDLEVSHERVGDIAVFQDDHDRAREHFRKALAIAQRLAESDPSNSLWAASQTVPLWRLVRLGDQPEERLRRALRVLKGLQEEGRLDAHYSAFIPDLESELAKISK